MFIKLLCGATIEWSEWGKVTKWVIILYTDNDTHDGKAHFLYIVYKKGPYFDHNILNYMLNKLK